MITIQATGPRRRAFTLIELLVVIAIIALLVGILLPALGKAKLAAQRGVSASNLGSLGRVQHQYASDFKDSFVNPFDPNTGQMYNNYSPAPAWYTVIKAAYSQSNANQIYGFNFDAPVRCSEGFAIYWTNYMMTYINSNDVGSKVQIDPADALMVAKYRTLDADQSNPAGVSDPNQLKDYSTSYWYPPLFWLQATRYQSENLQPINTAAGDSKWLARNRFDMVPQAAAKVLLTERFDTSQKKRRTGNSTQDAYPQWNNPGANPQVTTVDGSVTTVKMSALHALATSSDANVTAVFKPSGIWNPSAAFVDGAGLTETPLETGAAPFTGTTAWRQFFWGTRNGVRGYDLKR